MAYREWSEAIALSETIQVENDHLREVNANLVRSLYNAETDSNVQSSLVRRLQDEKAASHQELIRSRGLVEKLQQEN